MALSYPDNTIWYVRSWALDSKGVSQGSAAVANRLQEELSEGSAVAIRLQKKG